MGEHTISTRGSRSLDETPWTDGTRFSNSDWRKFDLAMRRFWGKKQLAYRGGEKVRTKIERRKPSRTLFDVIWNPKKRK
jgi:hypothetical protein